MWHKRSRKLPKILDYYLISNGVKFSVGIYEPELKIFIDSNMGPSAIPDEDVKYWLKISNPPTEKSSKYYNPMLRI